MADNEPNYTKPSSQIDLETRQAEDYEVPTKLIQGTDPKPSENGFIGTDPIYQNYANETEKPFLSDGGAEAEIEKNFVSEDADLDAGATAEGVGDQSPSSTPDESNEDKEPTGSGSSATAASSTTGATPTGPTPGSQS